MPSLTAAADETPGRVRLVEFERLAPEKGITYGRSTLRRLCRQQLFPQPIQLSPGRLAWIEGELDAWIAERSKHRGTLQPKAPGSRPPGKAERRQEQKEQTQGANRSGGVRSFVRG